MCAVYPVDSLLHKPTLDRFRFVSLNKVFYARNEGNGDYDNGNEARGIAGDWGTYTRGHERMERP